MIAKLILIALLIAGVWLVLRRAAIRPRLDAREACDVLGVAADADVETIKAAHRRLISAMHPDRGGSPELARRINAARDTLLRQRRD